MTFSGVFSNVMLVRFNMSNIPISNGPSKGCTTDHDNPRALRRAAEVRCVPKLYDYFLILMFYFVRLAFLLSRDEMQGAGEGMIAGYTEKQDVTGPKFSQNSCDIRRSAP